MAIRKCSLLHFTTIGDQSEGYITTTQYAHALPFAIKRVFWTYGTPPEVVRGRHAHKETEQVLVAVQGQIKVVTDNGREQETHLLDSPQKGLYLPPGYWTQIYLNAGAVLLCFASTEYQEEDYIRSYETFLRHLEA